jgi:GT2 family glycosyltransferase
MDGKRTMGIPTVYVIILSWNGRSDTLECLRSFKNVAYKNYRIVVVDNASVDGTVQAVRGEFPEIDIIVNSSNLRFAGGNNVGIKYAIEKGADFILLLNNDTLVDQNFLWMMVRTALSENNIGMVGPKIFYDNDKRRLWYAGGRIEWWKGWISHRGVREYDSGRYDDRCETDYITGCCILVKREVIENIGLLDESYYIYGEDADWCIRASRSGYKLLYEPSAIIWHKLSVSAGGHLSWFKNYNKLKSQLKFLFRYAKWYHWLTIPFGLFFNILASYRKMLRI